MIEEKLLSYEKQIDTVSNLFEFEFSGLNYDELNWKPVENVWSIAQNIEHLINTNLTYFPVIEYAKAGKLKTPFIAKIPGVPEFIGNNILKYVSPENRKKTKTFSIWQPSTGKVQKDILEQFLLHQSALKNLINDSSELFAKRTIISSPANKYVVYDLGKAFNIIIAHEERHFQQAREIKSIMVSKTNEI